MQLLKQEKEMKRQLCPTEKKMESKKRKTQQKGK